MASNKHDFEELAAPKTVAKKLGISVATLRKYSLIVEKITGKKDYYQRTKQHSRLYHEKDVADLAAFHHLAQRSGLTLQEAARQIYAVSKKHKALKKAKKPQSALANAPQIVKLLGALQQTIATQNKAINSLQAQMKQIEKQNQTLLEQQKKLSVPGSTDVAPEIAKMPDISGIVATKHASQEETREKEERQEVQADRKKSKSEVRREILSKAQENAKKKSTANVHRTLEDMQLPPKKRHWWQRFLNY